VSLVDKPGYPEFPTIVSNLGLQKSLFLLSHYKQILPPGISGLFFINANDILIPLLSKNNNSFYAITAIWVGNSMILPYRLRC
jgi:hypothetical protein